MDKIHHKDPVGIQGIHTISVCDVRHPGVKSLEQEIEREVTSWRKKATLIKKMFYKFMAKGLKDDADFARTQLNTLNQKHHFDLSEMYRIMQGLTLVDQKTVKNIIPTAGRAVITLWITGDNTYDAANGANYGSLGTDNTAPANGDTTLTTETYRKATSSATTANNIAYLSNFYTAAEVTGTFEEAGWHIDGTGSADTGQLLSHFLTTTTAKSATEALTVESTLTVS